MTWGATHQPCKWQFLSSANLKKQKTAPIPVCVTLTGQDKNDMVSVFSPISPWESGFCELYLLDLSDIKINNQTLFLNIRKVKWWLSYWNIYEYPHPSLKVVVFLLSLLLLSPLRWDSSCRSLLFRWQLNDCVKIVESGLWFQSMEEYLPSMLQMLSYNAAAHQ